jgi:photosystem II stability/assembly factor-like uncharacterized protein
MKNLVAFAYLKKHKHLKLYLYFLIQVFLSFNSYCQWTLTNGPTQYDCKTIRCLDSTCFVGVGNQGGIWKSVDGGANWHIVYSYLTNTSASDFVFHKNTIYASISSFSSSNQSGVLKSNDGGNSWSYNNNGFDYSSYFSVGSLASNDTLLFALSNKGVYKSINDGNNWIHSSNGIPNNANLYDICFHSNKIFVGSDSGMYYSANSGLNWVQSNSNLPLYSKIYQIISSENSIYIIVDNLGGNIGVYRSDNSGTNWIQVNNGLGNNIKIKSIAKNSNTIYSIAKNNYLSCCDSVFISFNNVINWSNVTNNLPVDLSLSYGRRLNNLEFSSKYLLLSSSKGIWRRNLSNNSIGIHSPTNTKNYLNIFPNPTSSFLNLEFADFNLLNGYSIKIYNSLSEVIYNKKITQHSEIIDLSKFCLNGIYFLQVINEQNNIIEIHKILVQL